MTTFHRLFPAGYTFADETDNVPVASGTVEFDISGSTTDKNVYDGPDSATATSLGHTLSLDSEGRFVNEPFGDVSETLYRVTVKNSSGSIVITPQDNVGRQDAAPGDVYIRTYGAALDGVKPDDAALALAEADAVGKRLIIDGPIRLDSSRTTPRTITVVRQGQVTMAAGERWVALKLIDEHQRFTSGINALDLRAFGNGPNQGISVDITPDLNDMAAEAAGTGGNFWNCYISLGTWHCNSKPDDLIWRTRIFGGGQSGTVVYKNWVSAAQTDGIFNYRYDDATTANSAGSVLAEMTCFSLAGSQSVGVGTGCHVSYVATATNAPDNCSIFNVNFTSDAATNTANTNSNIHIDGQLRISGAQGVRNIQFMGVNGFGCQTAAIIADGARGLYIDGRGFNEAGGVTGGGGLRVLSTASVSFLSGAIYCRLGTINGLNFSNVADFDINSSVDGPIENTSTATFGRFSGRAGHTTFEKNWSCEYSEQAPETVTAANTINENEYKKTFYLNNAAGFATTLPAPGNGSEFMFVVMTPPTSGNYTIATHDASNIIRGGVSELEVDTGDDGPWSGAANTITLVQNLSSAGDIIKLKSNGSSWFLHGHARLDGGLTLT